MHIVLAFLTVVGAVGYYLWVIRSSAAAVGEAAEAAGAVAARVRRSRARRRAGQSLAETVTDPRVAALGMLLGLARIDGDGPTEAQRALIGRLAAARLGAGASEAAAMMRAAQEIIGESPNVDETMRKLTRVLQRLAPDAAHRDLVEMMRDVAESAAPKRELHDLAIERARRAFGLERL